ncbi:MAG: ATP-binding protein [Pseudonocardiaceae bacterium]
MTLAELLDYLPRGDLLDHAAWQRRHRFLRWVLGLHLPAILAFGLFMGRSLSMILCILIIPVLCLVIEMYVRHRRVASFLVTAGLAYNAAAFVVLSHGLIEAHFHFFVIIGLIALYQDWVLFLWNIVFTVLSHGLGSAWQSGIIFNHLPAQTNPWLWSLLHGSAVLAACVGVVVFWRETENQQQKTLALTTQLAEAEITQRKFTSELLVNLARRNQSMLYRQLDIINQLEEKERDPDALSELFRLDHLATRIRRNAESLLVLSGEEPTRVWSEPVRLVDVVRAAIAETEDLDRVTFAVDERMEVRGHTVTDLTHVLAELTENAVRFSPPEANVTIRTRPYLRIPGAAVLTVEDWGIGMRAEDLAAANDLLAHPRDVDLSVSQRLGLRVMTRLAARHNIKVSLTPTPGTGVTAVVVLPAELFAENPRKLSIPKFVGVAAGARGASLPAPLGPGPDIPLPRRTTNGDVRSNRNGTHGMHARPDHGEEWSGWWTPTRLPTVEASRWVAPGYGSADPVISEAPPALQPTPAPLISTVALPPAPASPPAPAHAPARAPADSPGPAVIARNAPDTGMAVDSALPVGASSPASAEFRLTRRVPQANLSPELRRATQPAGPTSGPTSGPTTSPDAEQARDALSRFQASRQAAQQQVDSDLGTPHRARHGS